jgi:hypothetical protein
MYALHDADEVPIAAQTVQHGSVSHPVFERNRMRLICASKSSFVHTYDRRYKCIPEQCHNEREYHSTLCI